ncbi:MAG TPA: hypothetical protein VE172_22335 [Stackebrandtia sp.]|jgi:V8-like Glu-specific endopeptidase|uniref:hypothetical protein n=1 Tax=Stackebrandtia sp. TaxID=2023065 RepID=UPI002D50D9AF|nr:hypothetical protein [Stackebrandtia sp.]HZE41547.1 hypothetical protein [Stackebrandtia sp.]
MRKRLLAAIVATSAVALTAIAYTATASADPQPHPTLTTHATTSKATRDAPGDYWTPRRIAAAKPKPAPKVDSGIATKSHKGAETVIPGTSVDGKAVTESIGRLLFSDDTGDYICSATVISSQNKSVIATARHCGFNSGGKNYRFAPNYNQGNAPYGWWDWKSAGWVTGGDGITDDYAFIVLNQQDGKSVGDVVGSTGVAFNKDIGVDAHIVGIPGATDAVTQCTGKAYAGPQSQQLMDNCDGMSGGASGGAWVVDYQGDGSATQTGTYFGSYGDAAAGSYFDDDAKGVYDGAQTA